MADAGIDRVRQVLGARYLVERELGRGGMGTVYLARDLTLDRAVALKVLPPDFAADTALRERFLRETRTSASFSHPNIVPVHAIEESDKLVAYVMGYVEGESLAQRVTRVGPLSVREVVRLLQDIGYALAYAHGRGVVHRDLKPDNVMIERATGRALLMDFGIARAISPGAQTAGLTRVGEIVGTPEYMSPEQATADVIDGRSDLYSLGLVAYFAATGVSAMFGESPQRMLVRQLTEAVPPIASARSDFPSELSRAIDRCCAKEPADRFETAEALVEAIDLTQLRGVEVPIPIRMFAQELGTLGMMLIAVTLLSWYLLRTAPPDLGFFDKLLPLLFLFGIVLTRVLQTLSQGRRLAVLGFPASQIMTGLRATVSEREGMRTALRLSADTVTRRRKSVISAALMLLLAIGMVYLALRMRVALAPGRFQSPPLGIALVVTGFILAGVSVVVLIRSPFRAPLGEKLFRFVWLGPLGSALVRFATRGATTDAPQERSGITGGVSVTAPSALTAQRVVPASVSSTSIEDRVAALEAWRRSQG
jgi:eukaryotic-like serine/threonine-protein kinase